MKPGTKIIINNEWPELVSVYSFIQVLPFYLVQTAGETGEFDTQKLDGESCLGPYASILFRFPVIMNASHFNFLVDPSPELINGIDIFVPLVYHKLLRKKRTPHFWSTGDILCYHRSRISINQYHTFVLKAQSILKYHNIFPPCCFYKEVIITHV